MADSIVFVIVVIVACALFACYKIFQLQERQEFQDTARREGIGDEYQLDLKEQLKFQSLRPKDDPAGPDPYREALHIARLRKNIVAKNLSSSGKIIFNISHSTIASLNLGTVLGDLSASVETLQIQGDKQLADAIGKLTTAITESVEIRDVNRKDLLENLSLVSKEVSSDPDQRRPGLLKSALGLITTSLASAKQLTHLVHDLHEKLKALGIID